MYLLKNELKFILKSKAMILLMSTACVIMTIGINSLNMSNDFDLFYIKRSSSTISFGSAKFGASICSLLFGLCTVLILDKDKRKRSKALIEANQNYYNIMVIRIITIVLFEFLVTLLGMIVVMAMQKFLYYIPIGISYYLFNYFVIFFPSLLFSTLIISGLFLLTDSLDISFLTFGVIFAQSLFSNNYLFTWVQTNIDIISDFAGIAPVGKTIIYNRLLWFFICLTIFCIGLLFKRRYEYDLWNSFLLNIKNKGLIVLLILAILGSGFIYIKEPYTMDLGRNYETIDEKVYLTSLSPKITFNSYKGEMDGEVMYNFINKGSEFIRFCINEGLKIESIKVNGKEIEYKKDKNENIVQIAIPSAEKIEIIISYGGRIKTDKYAVGKGMPGYISKDSIYLLENSNWIFKPLVKSGDFISISGYFIAPDHLTVVVPGVLLNTETNNGFKKWMFTYESHTADIGVFAGKYKKSQIAFENMNVEFYYSGRHEEYIEKMKIEEHIKDIMKYYTENIGQYYSNIYPLKIVEVALYKQGGHSSENVISISENMLNRDKNMYSLMDNENIQYIDMRFDVYMKDISVIAHEMAHQWWGTGVNAVEDSPWSSEGLAQYSSYKYIQDKFGDMESRLFLSRWESRVAELKNYYYINNSEMLDNVNENYRKSLEMEKLQSELYYLMPIKLMRGEEVLGEEEFLKRFRSIYHNHLLQDLTYEEFLKEMNLSEEDMKVE